MTHSIQILKFNRSSLASLFFHDVNLEADNINRENVTNLKIEN